MVARLDVRVDPDQLRERRDLVAVDRAEGRTRLDPTDALTREPEEAADARVLS